MKFTGWERGTLIAEISDYRCEPVFRDRVKLGIGEDVRRHSLNLLTDLDRIETECGLIKLSNPGICVDPSPNVARLQSVADWRRKTWLHGGNREFRVRRGGQTERVVARERVPDLVKGRQAVVELPSELVEELLRVNVRKDK
jgi:hypothetical protein